MILPIERIEAHLARVCPEHMDAVLSVRASVIKRAAVFANDWPMFQIGSGIYMRELNRFGLTYLQAQRVGLQVHSLLSNYR